MKTSLRQLTLFLYIPLLLGFLCLCPKAFAQAPPPDVNAADRAAAKTVDRSLREEAEEKLIPMPTKIPEKKKKEEEPEPIGKKLFVKKIKIQGAANISPDDLRPIIEPYENKENTVEGLGRLAKKIERAYLKQGIIAACFIPPQDVKEGIITLQVVEAKMGDLQVKGNKFFNKERIHYFWDINSGGLLYYDKMNSSLQFINKNPDREAKATLHAGKKPETTDVILDIKTHLPIHSFFSFDKEGSISTGRARTGYGIRHNNFLGIDDTLLMGRTLGKNFNGIYMYHTVPITPFGTSLMYGYSDSQSSPKKEFEILGITSRSQNTSIFIHQDIYKKAEYMGEVAIGLDFKDKSTSTMNDGTLNKDRFRTLQLKSTLIHRYPGCITYFKPQITQGLNMLGSRSRNEFSSRTSDSTFTKINIDINHKRALPLNLQASLNFKSQIASEILASQEGLSLGGIDSVRGYPSQDYVADSGIQANFELLIPSFWIPEKIKLPYEENFLKKNVTTLIFYDYAYGEKRGTASNETPNMELTSFGVGIRWRLYNQALLRFEWGFPIGNTPISEHYDAPARFHVSISFEDRFHEELERIRKLAKEDYIKTISWRLLDTEINDPASPIGQELRDSLKHAQLTDKNIDPEKAKMYYSAIKQLGDSLYQQTEQYVRERIALQNELKAKNKTAIKLFEKGDIETAKNLWQEIIEHAKISTPLMLRI